jgi:uncharacterized protein YbbK (DUF523 family)
VWIVSACLAGIPCRYDGGANTVPALADLVARGEAVPVCPECLGGLPTPRIPSERLADGRVVNAAGEDVTAAFRRGAERALELCRAHGCTCAVLKARSPSCGRGCIYDGTFTHTRVPGDGVFAALLEQEGISILTEEEYSQP